MNAQEFFTMVGLAMCCLLALAAVIGAVGQVRRVVLWNYYRGLRRQMRETIDMLEAEFPEEQRFSRDVVTDMLATLHDRLYPNAENLRWTQQLIDEAAPPSPAASERVEIMLEAISLESREWRDQSLREAITSAFQKIDAAFAARKADGCQHQFHYFGDQVKARRCVHCNALEKADGNAEVKPS